MYLSENEYISKESHSYKKKDGNVNCTITIYEVENGFIICTEETKIPKEGSKSPVYTEPKVSVYINKTNPLAVKKQKEDDIATIEKLLEGEY